VVPALGRQADRRHERRLKSYQAELERAAWVREHQAIAYERLETAISDHEQLHDEPQDVLTMDWLNSGSDKRDGGASTYNELTLEQARAWKQARASVLSSAACQTRMWMSGSVSSLWEVLERTAGWHDTAVLDATGPHGPLAVSGGDAGQPSDTALRIRLSEARSEVRQQMALDLQGPAVLSRSNELMEQGVSPGGSQRQVRRFSE
jgi:hypothetical protein